MQVLLSTGEIYGRNMVHYGDNSGSQWEVYESVGIFKGAPTSFGDVPFSLSVSRL